MADNLSSPLFADRYRFETVSDDWDRGRSGYTHLVYDLKEKRLGVIKRAETNSKQSTDGFKSEVNALKALKGLGVPEVYDTNQAVYGSKNYDYMVIEYIDGIRVEKNLSSISAVERAEIITQLFGLLSQAHQKGIVNGDVDLKHLFWRREKRQLTVIDWGNAKLGIDLRKNTEFAYDLARAAEIIFSLVTSQGYSPSTGSIALPDDKSMIAGLETLPPEFRDLCKWAPRTPSGNAQAPYTAQELHETSKKWTPTIAGSTPDQIPRPTSRWVQLIMIFLILLVVGVFFLVKSLLPILQAVSPTSTSLPSSLIAPSNTPALVETMTVAETPTSAIIPTGIITLPLATTPSPSVYSPVLTLDRNEELVNCWLNEAVPSSALILNDGFSRRTDRYWHFNVGIKHPIEDIVQVDFRQCLENKQVAALGLNIAITRLEIERDVPIHVAGREFGFFLEYQNGQRREYTLWIDKSEALHVRVREEDTIYDNIILIVNSSNIDHGGSLRRFTTFPIQIYFEINNMGLDILYLLEGSLENPTKLGNIDINQMMRVDNVVRPNLGDVQRIGLVGRGGKTEVQIWSLIFFERLSD